jgi:hypothetical protein
MAEYPGHGVRAKQKHPSQKPQMASPVTTSEPTATIELRPTGWAVLTPPVPEVRELLRYSEVEFEAGGPLGHSMELVESAWLAPVITRRRYSLEAEKGDVREVQVVPQGLVPQVADLLETLGYAVELRDLRRDSPRWSRRADWKMFVPREHRAAVEAVGEHRSLRVVGFDADRVAGTIVGVARAYPEATIAVAVTTYKQLWRLLRKLRAALDEPLGLYTAKEKTAGRVSVGMIGQLPRDGGSEWDLLVLPFAERMVGDSALYAVMSGRYGRVLSFSRARHTGDADLDRRFLVVAGRVWPDEKVPLPVTVVMLPAHGTRPGEMKDAFEQKTQLYWRNARRNRRVAEVAKQLVRAKKRAVRALVGDEQLVEQVCAAAKTGVAILVESLAHAHVLAALLPGWAVWTANELEAAQPEPGCGVITTERAAKETVVRAEVLIRVTGTRWALPQIDWPYPEFAKSGILVDFADDFHPLAKRNAAARVEGYEEAGMTVHTGVAPKNTSRTTGASG